MVTETASWGRRILALVIDWAASSLAVIAFQGLDYNEWFVLLVFVVETAVFTALLGGSFGKLVTRLRVVRRDGSSQPLGLIPALVRSILVALVVPPLVFKEDGRGLHDLAVRSQTVAL